MPVVELRITALPVHVSTARQIAVAVGRRSGMPEDVLQDVRLAVGEAAGLTVSLHEQLAPEVPVGLRFADDDGLTIGVYGAVGLPEASGDAARRVLNAVHKTNGKVEQLPPDAVLAVLGEVTSALDVVTGPAGSRLVMRWLPSYRQT